MAEGWKEGNPEARTRIQGQLFQHYPPSDADHQGIEDSKLRHSLLGEYDGIALMEKT